MNNLYNHILRILRKVLPKDNITKSLEEIEKFIDIPDNYGKVAFMYLRLHNQYAVMIGKNGDDDYNFRASQIYHNQYMRYRELWIEHKNRSL